MSTARHVPLAERLALLRISVLPVWVYDHDWGRFRWANTRALEVWRAESEAELLARDFSDVSAATRTRLDSYMAALRRGEGVVEDWTLYPRGKPTTMTLHGSGVELDDGRLAILFQAVLKETQLAASMVRGVEALRHTSLLVSLIGVDGEVLFLNPAALRAFGDVKSIAGWFADGGQALLRTVAAGGDYVAEERVRVLDGERWHAIQARTATDPVTGEGAVLLQQIDVGDRRHAEDLAATRNQLLGELGATLAVVERQRQEILALSAPLLAVGEHTLAVPLIGSLGQGRIGELSQRLLPAIQDRSARHVILDLTGCGELQVDEVDGLRRLARAIGLLGARPLLTGIRPSLARAMIDSSADLAGLQTLPTLREAIALCSAAKTHTTRLPEQAPAGARNNR